MGELPVFPLAPAPFTGVCRRAEAGACFDWLRQGWALFAAYPATWLGTTLLALVLWLALLIVPLVGGLVATLLFPVMLAGFLQMCRRQSEGQEPRLADLFAGFSKNHSALVLIGVAFTVAIQVIGLLAGWLARAGVSGPLDAGTFIGSSARGLLVALPLSVPVLMVLWFAPVLAFFHDLPATAALKASFSACATNWLPFAVYGLILMVLTFFAALPVMLGFLLLIPVLSGALYASYRDIFPAA